MASEHRPRRQRDGILSAISVGFFFVLIGIIFISTPDLVGKISNFFNDITLVHISRLPNNIFLPQPASVSAHTAVYSAAQLFSLVWAVFLVAMLVLRFVMGSPIRNKAENLGDIVYWFGSAYLIQTWLIGRSEWFQYWALIVVLAGIGLIVRAVFLAAAFAVKK